ncbi:MAG: ATP-binding cassette domain-containing protein [Candidatus Berkiella sp.]
MQVIDMDFKIGNNWLFKSLNINFTNGITVITGNNGCGKSTLLRILSGLCEPTNGTVLFNNKNLYTHPESKQLISYVPSTPFLYPYLTLYENINICGTLRQLSQKEIKTNLVQIFEQCQLTGYENCLFDALSDGMKKKAMLACALIHHPKLLILDEPNTTLSPFSREKLWEVLNQFANQGIDIILCSHHLEDINHCKAHYVLESGKLHLQAQMQVFSQIVLTQNQDEALKGSADEKYL